MASKAPVSVNGVAITAGQINAEMQYHPAPAMLDARYQAMRALVVRELLLQRAAKLGLKRDNPDEAIDKLLALEIEIPDMTEAECRRYYDNNKARFVTSPLFEAAHILYLAPPDDKEARASALQLANAALAQIREQPSLFASIAERDSACVSGREGGRLGQIARRQTLPAFEEALMQMKVGELSAKPVETGVGYHIIRLDRRIEAEQLPYESVRKWIAGHLHSQCWQRAVSQYIQMLAGEAAISGFSLKASETPLVQ